LELQKKKAKEQQEKMEELALLQNQKAIDQK